MLVFVGEANMANETVLTIDIVQLRVVAKYFHLINHDIEQEKDVSLQFPSSVTLADCQAFLDIIIQTKPILPKLLSVLHASIVFILADYFCVDLVFEELHVCFAHNLTLSPLFMKLFLMYYSYTHPQTIDFYHAFTESFRIPKSKFMLQNASCTGMKAIQKIARDHLRRTVYMESLRIATCYACKRKITYTLKFSDNKNMVYDNKKVTKMPCCATPTHPWCTYKMLYRRSGFYCCTRCRTILHNGQASFVDINYSRERMNIRNRYGISTRRVLPSLDLNSIFSTTNCLLHKDQ